jgi:hypothetical protein
MTTKLARVSSVAQARKLGISEGKGNLPVPALRTPSKALSKRRRFLYICRKISWVAQRGLLAQLLQAYFV